MEIIIDSHLDTEVKNVQYGGFWPRLWALFIDFAILSPVTLFFTYYNFLILKQPVLYIVISVIGLLYKPFMENKYGATLGKMAMKLKVVNNGFEKANLTEILLRNCFGIGIGIMSVAMGIGIFYTPGFENINTFMDYNAFVTQNNKIQMSVSYFLGLLYLVDLIFLLTNDQKRSLHDKIGQTFVIKTN